MDRVREPSLRCKLGWNCELPEDEDYILFIFLISVLQSPGTFIDQRAPLGEEEGGDDQVDGPSPSTNQVGPSHLG